jgi:hypothetical protein
MTERLAVCPCVDATELLEATIAEIKRLGAKMFPLPGIGYTPLKACIEMVAQFGAVTIIVQRRVFDPDFSAEYAVYYSQQFRDVPRTCTRLHFFEQGAAADEDPLHFLDRVAEDRYLGFVTLRPVPRAPVGAAILAKRAAAPHVVCSSDRFPVHIAGKHFELDGTPFMQQDNAVAVCAQASIWMALRTLRRREGDRAHNPAQITDAATRYLISDRTRPNKGGLTTQQMAEAVRVAGYSPLLMQLGDPSAPMQPDALEAARRQLHPYIESDIPVLLALKTPQGGHAIAAIGHTWRAVPAAAEMVFAVPEAGAVPMRFCHAVSWAPELLVHNDNSGPYRVLPAAAQPDVYSLSQVFHAIPLLPADVFMTAEEAMPCGLSVLRQLLEALAAHVGEPVVQAIAEALVVRLLLVDKSRLRKWAANAAMPPELSSWVRTQDLPRRVWALEVHKQAYFSHPATPASLVGLVFIDPTSDALDVDAHIMTYLNFTAVAGIGAGTIFHGNPVVGSQTTVHGPIVPMERVR